MALRTPAVAGYLAADVLRAQRYLIPLLLYAIVMGILLGGAPGPPPGPWPATALALYPAAAWFALVIANTENPVHRSRSSRPRWASRSPALPAPSPGGSTGDTDP